MKPHNPTPADIARETERIRAEWTELEERRRRCCDVMMEWNLPCVRSEAREPESDK